MKKKNNKTEIVPELFKKALSVKFGGTAYWNYVSKLRRNGTRQTFLIAKQLCNASDEHSRALGIDVLCQLRYYSDQTKSQKIPDSKPVFRKASIDLIRPLLQDSRINVFVSAIYGMGHLNPKNKAQWISRFSRHRNSEVRYAVAFALGGDETPIAIRTLIRLSEDENAKVRDWATFGIGDLMEKDTPEIREALFRRLSDRSVYARNEGRIGLAKLKDARVIKSILRDLSTSNPRVRTLEAAEEFGHPVFLPILKKHWYELKRQGKRSGYWYSHLMDAIKACTAQQKRRSKLS